MPPKADLLLLNARVLTLEPAQPRASTIAIKGNRILAVGSQEELNPIAAPQTRRQNCYGMTLIPGFHDAHCHILSLSSRLLQLDCGPDKAPDIPTLISLISQQARRTPPGQWIRAFGYDESLLKESRHPTAADLDRAAPEHPVRLDHRTGHATVLNSAAMKLLDISPNSQGSPHGVMLRDESGSPSGVFLDMTTEISRIMRPFRRKDEFEESVRKANAFLLSKGITSIQDAGAGNGLEQWRTFRRLKCDGTLTPRITMMTGLNHADAVYAETSHNQPSQPRIGAVKIMVTSTTGALHPTLDELTEIATHHHRKGRQLAFHAIEAEAVIAAVQAIATASYAHPRLDPRHRIEHCAEAPPEILQLVKESGATVVTQPGFIHHHGAKYLANVEPGLLPHLYPLSGLTTLGIPWAASSDAPVTPPNPLLHVQSAVTRQTSDGRRVGPNQAVSVLQALNAWTINAARSNFQKASIGSIKPGKYADLVLLTNDPTQTPTDEIGNIGVAMTIVGGRIVWQA